jgi:hypothetical protein
MKKKMLQITSLLVLAILCAVVSAQAQTITVYTADIDFDFAIGNQNYQAGKYTVHLKRPDKLATILTVRDEKGRALQVTAVMKNGSTSESEDTTLVFNRFGNQYVLDRIAAPDFGFTAPDSKVIDRLAKNARKRPETVAVILRKPGKYVE